MNTFLPTVESGSSFVIRSRHYPHHAATKTACMTAIVVGLALALPGATKAADGGQSNVHPSSGFSVPAYGLAWDDGVGNGSTRVSDTARPQPNAGGGHFSPAVGGNQTARQMPGSPGESVRREETVVQDEILGASLTSVLERLGVTHTQEGAKPSASFKRTLAVFSVSIALACGLLAVASCALSGRLQDPR